MAQQITLTLYIQNSYAREEYADVDKTVTVALPMPTAADVMADDLEQWAEDNIFPLTGTGQTKGDAWYDVEVLESSHENFIPTGITWDWGY